MGLKACTRTSFLKYQFKISFGAAKIVSFWTLTHFPAQAQKTPKNLPRKAFLIFAEM